MVGATIPAGMPDTPIYMDHHATTPVDERVLAAMLPYFSERFGNAASRVHMHGKTAQEAVEAARAEVAALIGAAESEVTFTSGATESDNLAILGTARALASEGKHVVTVQTEHKAVLDPFAALERDGWRVTRLRVDARGLIATEEVEAALGPDTILVSVMLANNEIGVAQDLEAVGTMTRERGIVFHCDAAQGLGYLPFSVDAMHIDLASLSAHKMYGPKGTGALYVSHGLRARGVPEPLMYGGGHEQGLRPGTIDVPSVVGFGVAADIMRREGEEEARRLAKLRNSLEDRLIESLDEVRVNGAGAPRHPGNLNVSFGYVDGAALLLRLCNTVSVSSGAACSSAQAGPSYVLEELGVPKDWATASIRFGLGRHTTEADVEQAAQAAVAAVTHLRERSALWAARQSGTEIDW